MVSSFNRRGMLKIGAVAAVTPLVWNATQATSPAQAKTLLTPMDGANPDWWPDPMNPGGPMIPTEQWDWSPYSRWTFQHVREQTMTATIRREPGHVLPLQERHADIDGIEFEANGQRSTIREWLDTSFTDGFLVLSRGKIMAEKYMNGMTPYQPHTAMSMSKSITATLFGILVHKGLIDTKSLVTRYLPELEATAYRGATVQHVLDMTSGVVGPGWEEFAVATGVYPQHPNHPRNSWELLLRLTRQEAPHGERFKYRNCETLVLGFIIQRVTGKMLPELFSSELWAPMGAEEDADISVDRAHFGRTSGGINATLRDYARFALLHVRGGKLNGKQIIPSEWIEAIRRPDPHLFQILDDGSRPNVPEGAYHNQFWIEDAERAAYFCYGSGGQVIYMDPQTDFALVKLSYRPDDGVDVLEYVIKARAAIHAIRDALAH